MVLVPIASSAVVLKALLETGKLESQEKENLIALVLSSDVGWENADRCTIIESIELAGKTRRREAQCWGGNVLNIFTEDEWKHWKAIGTPGMHETLVWGGVAWPPNNGNIQICV